MGRSPTALVVFVAAVAALTSCSSGGSEAADGPATLETPNTTTPKSTAPSDAPDRFDGCSERSEGSSPAVFDETAGTYAVQALEYTPEAGEVEFDVVQWLIGDDAVAAYLAENPDDPEGPPNDYYIVNENSQMRNGIVDPVVIPLVVSPDGDTSPDVSAIGLDQLADYLTTDFEGTTYWLTFQDGTVTAICEQFVP